LIFPAIRTLRRRPARTVWGLVLSDGAVIAVDTNAKVTDMLVNRHLLAFDHLGIVLMAGSFPAHFHELLLKRSLFPVLSHWEVRHWEKDHTP